MTNVKKYARKTALAVAALIAITVGSARLYAYGQSVGRADVAALDAGVDPVVAADHFVDAGVLPPSLAPHADPAANPAATLSEFQQARRTGGLQLALGVLVAVIAGAIRARLQPTGEPEPPPDTWRARTVALLGAAAMLAWGVADRAAGATSWIGLATIAVGAAALVWRAVNPPKGSKKPDESKA